MASTGLTITAKAILMAFGISAHRELAFTHSQCREIALANVRLWKSDGIYSRYWLGAGMVAGSCLGGELVYPYVPPVIPPVEPVVTITAAVYVGSGFAVGLNTSGAVVGAGDSNGYYGIAEWPTVKYVTGGGRHIAGLTVDGKVVCAGWSPITRSEYGYAWAGNAPAYTEWTDMIDVAIGDSVVVGLKSDGTVMFNAVDDFTGLDFATIVAQFHGVSAWTDITAVAAGLANIVGLKADGTVVSVGSNASNQQNVDWLTDVVKIRCGYDHVVVQRSDGTVIGIGDNTYGQCSNLTMFSGVADIGASCDVTSLLMDDGTAIVTGDTSWGQGDTGSWTGLIGLAAGGWDTLGLLPDGAVLWVGKPIYYGGGVGIGVVDWDLI